MASLIPNVTILNTTFVWKAKTEYVLSSPHFQLIYLASGMISGGLQLPNGEWLYKNDGRLLDSRMMLVPPGASFRGEFDSPSEEFVVFEFDCEDLKFDSDQRVFTLPLDDGTCQQLTPSLYLQAHEVLRIRPTVSTAHVRFHHQPASEGAKLAATMAVVGLLTWLFILPECPPSERDMSPAAHLKAMIDKEPGWKVPMTAMFKEIGMSPQALRREFRKEFGMTPMNYRERKRRHLAFSYIRETRLPLKTICERLGMKSPTHLSIYIRMVANKTPRQLRSEAQAQHRQKILQKS